MERDEAYVKWEKRHKGLCRNEYYVGTPATRKVVEIYSEVTYKLEPAKIKVTFQAAHTQHSQQSSIPRAATVLLQYSTMCCTGLTTCCWNSFLCSAGP